MLFLVKSIEVIFYYTWQREEETELKMKEMAKLSLIIFLKFQMY